MVHAGRPVSGVVRHLLLLLQGHRPRQPRSSAGWQYNRNNFGLSNVQGGWGEWPTGNGKKVSNSQAIAKHVHGCCLISFHFLWAILPIRPVGNLKLKLKVVFQAKTQAKMFAVNCLPVPQVATAASPVLDPAAGRLEGGQRHRVGQVRRRQCRRPGWTRESTWVGQGPKKLTEKSTEKPLEFPLEIPYTKKSSRNG